MAYNPEIHHRRSIRLQGYDYSQSGAYFITICTFQRQHLFGTVNNGEMQLNVTGQVVYTIWQKIPQHFPNVELDQFILMPDHLHGIIVISEKHEKSHSLATVIQNFKSTSTRKVNKALIKILVCLSGREIITKGLLEVIKNYIICVSIF